MSTAIPQEADDVAPAQVAFIISAPRSGSTLLERILEAHSEIRGGPEPHLLTPLAHTGPMYAVDAAPYDPLRVHAGLARFLDEYGGEHAYFRACRTYCEKLYRAWLEGTGKRVCLDKTPAYALVLPFIVRVFPDAKYIVLTRHPLATFASYANSFFFGDYEAAHAYNPILNRYVPALADFLRLNDPAPLHVRYEDFTEAPDVWLERIHAYLGVSFEPDTLEYGAAGTSRKGLGDPLGVRQHARPSTAPQHKWAREAAADPSKRRFLEARIDELNPDDLATLGYPRDELWAPLDEAADRPPPKAGRRLSPYRLQRLAILRVRSLVQARPALQRLLKTVRKNLEFITDD